MFNQGVYDFVAAHIDRPDVIYNRLLELGANTSELANALNLPESQVVSYFTNAGIDTSAPAAAPAATSPSPYLTSDAPRYQSYTDTVGDAEQTIQPHVPHEIVWVALARQEGIEPEIYQGVGDSYEAVPNPAYLAWKEAKKAEGLDIGVNQKSNYTADYVILKNGVPITEPQSFRTGSTLAEGLVQLAPIALAAFGGHLYGAGGVGLSAAEQAAAIAAGDVLGGVGAAGAGLGATGAGAGGAGFVGLENELAGLAAAEAGMAVPGAALPGIETALAGGAAGVSAYEAAAAAKAAADIAARTAATPTPGTPPGTTPPGGTTVPNVPAGTIPWGEIIATLGSLYGGSQAAEAARDAARIQAEAMDRALALQTRMYEEGVQRQAPFLQGGTEAFNRLTALSTGGPAAAQNFLTMDPGYGFRLGEGMKALDRMQASRGNLLSGGAIKAGQRYAQDVASQEYGSAYNRLAQLADVGPRAAGVTSQLGQNYATSAGNLMSQQGTGSANALLAGAAASQSAYGDVGEIWGRYFGGGK